MRRCFQCGALTDVAGLTRVGDGEFCATCFRALLDSGAADTGGSASAGGDARGRTSEQAQPAREPAAPRGRPPGPGHSTCLVCDRDLTDAPALVFLGGEICEPCSAEMAAELEAAHAGPSTEPSGDVAGRPRGPADERPAPSSFTPGTGTVVCAGCERPMPGPGSYRVLRGKAYCSACLPFFARLPPSVYEAASELGNEPGNDSAASCPDSAPASRSPSSSPLARPGECDCCRRALDPSAQLREGFELCSACWTSDAELALSVARARHRRALARLRSKLEGGS